MRFGRRSRRNSGDNGYRKKMKLKTKIQYLGVILLAISFAISFYDLKYHTPQTLPFVIAFAFIGMAMILQRKLLVGLKNMTKAQCQCCKCQNCGRNHNHWTHDDDDTRRSHY